MMEYPFVYEHRGVKHMLYNGNGFGETGIGYAVLDEDDRVGPGEAALSAWQRASGLRQKSRGA